MKTSNITKNDLNKLNDYLYEIPKSFRSDMRVPARVFASDKTIDQLFQDKSMSQLINITTLPGIQRYALGLPDMHMGYGFPIGGVAATDYKSGVVSPGGIGFDINCGVRLLRSNLDFYDLQGKKEKLANTLHKSVPSGVGKGGKFNWSDEKLNKVLDSGVKTLMDLGFASKEDLDHCEGKGNLDGDPSFVSQRAKNRGRDQLGTLGSGNHFIEVQKVEKIFKEKEAKKMGLKENMITVMIHTGSRGLGHQVCTDWVKKFNQKSKEWGINLPDKELACAPINSKEGQGYIKAMKATANYAWSNRQMITHLTREVWQDIFKKSFLSLIYDVAHNIGKIENYKINGKDKKLFVHRKGATRAFPKGKEDVPESYKDIGQPVLIPGSMGTSSYVLVGEEKGEEAFYSSCHGAGRTMSRSAAKKKVWGEDLVKDLKAKGIIAKCSSPASLAEEAPLAYKNVTNVVDIVEKAGIASKVAKLKPLIVIKGD